MANVRAVDGTYISYPFLKDGDTQTKVYNMVCTQLESSYSASQIALDTPMSSAANAGVVELPFDADSNAYFVGDTGHSPAGGGLISFTRTFANIPQSITVPSGSAFYSFPGIGDGNLQIASMSMTYGTDGIFITTATPHGFFVGDRAYYIGVAFSDDGSNTPNNGFGDLEEGSRQVTYSVVSEVTSSTEFRIDPELDSPLNQQVTLQPISGEIINRNIAAATVGSVAMNASGVGVIITTTTAHGFSAGDLVNIIMRFTVGTDPFVYVVNGRYEVQSIAGTNAFILDVGLYWSSYQLINVSPNGRVYRKGYGRRPISLNVVTDTRYDYILPGVTQGISNVNDISIPSAFRVLEGDAVTDTTQNASVVYTGTQYFYTNPTEPNSTEYLSMITNKGNIVIESSLNEWAGNILVLKTKTCKAK